MALPGSWDLGRTFGNLCEENHRVWSGIFLDSSVEHELNINQGSMTRLAKNLARDSNFLVHLGVAVEDALKIVEAMKSQGLFGDAYSNKSKVTGRPTRPTAAHLQKSNSMKIRSLVNECAAMVEGLSTAIDLHDESILSNALRSIAAKAEESKELQNGLVKAGICPVISQAARASGPSTAVAESALIAISLLSRYGEDRTTQSMDNILAFGESGAAEAVVSILRSHGDDGHIVSLACEVICHLTVVEINRNRFGEVGAIELLLRALLHYSLDPTNTQCPAIISALSYSTFKHAANRARLSDAETRVSS